MSGPKHNGRSAPSTCPPTRPSALVDLLVDEVLDRRSVALAAPADNIEEPEVLRRVDGSSVYTVAGADLYTSQRILDAEQRLVDRRGTPRRRVRRRRRRSIWPCWRWRRTAPHSMLGRPHWSARCAPPDARLQLAIAPAGAGKTTAMRALALAWTQDGGQVVGLAPSAAAAAVLREQTGIRTDTLAKLTWSLHHGDLPDWAAADRPVNPGDHRRSRHGRHPLPRHRRRSSPSVAVGVSGWSVMINNSPRSAPAASSATSNTPTAPSS